MEWYYTPSPLPCPSCCLTTHKPGFPFQPLLSALSWFRSRTLAPWPNAGHGALAGVRPPRRNRPFRAQRNPYALQEPRPAHPSAAAARRLAFDNARYDIGRIVPSVRAEPPPIGGRLGLSDEDLWQVWFLYCRFIGSEEDSKRPRVKFWHIPPTQTLIGALFFCWIEKFG